MNATLSSEKSVTYWIDKLKGGDSDAPQQIWERYFTQLVRLVRQKLHGFPRRAADEEDVALSAFHSLCKGVDRGRFPQLDDRHDLWQVLVTLAGWKVTNLRKHEQAAKRGGGKVRGDSAFAEPGADRNAGLCVVADEGPTPEDAALLADECRARLEQLGDDTLRQVALLKMEGHSHEEIADRLGCVVRTIERKVQVIRAIWSNGRREDCGPP